MGFPGDRALQGCQSAELKSHGNTNRDELYLHPQFLQESLNPRMMCNGVLGTEPRDRTSVLRKEMLTASLIPSFLHVRTQNEGTICEPRKSLTRHGIHQHIDWGFPSLWNGGK